jgi:hypothetical protein
MISSTLYSTPYWAFYLILFQCSLQCFTWSYLCSSLCNDHYNRSEMPVVTRSQEKLKHSSINEDNDHPFHHTNSTNESLRSINEQQFLAISSAGSIHEPSSSTSSIILSSSSTVFPHDCRSVDSSDVSTIQPLETDPELVESLRFQIRNFENLQFENSQSLSALDYKISSHHLKSHNSIMEEDCTDISKPTSENGIPDINQLFVALSAQMTLQTSSMQENCLLILRRWFKPMTVSNKKFVMN